MPADALTDATDWRWWYSLPVDDDDKALLFYADGTVRFRHRCDRGERGVIICAPALQLKKEPIYQPGAPTMNPGGHTITTTNPVTDRHIPVTVEPSILCPDCGTHGFVRNGRWVA